MENYLYGTMQNLFEIWWNKQVAREYAAKHPEEQNTDTSVLEIKSLMGSFSVLSVAVHNLLKLL